MAVYVISDLHLSLSTDKPMDVFGGWDNYVEKIEKNWRDTVGVNDTVVIPGDISWAMKLRDTAADFDFINRLPGNKIIGKGNHDLWWESVTKMNRFLVDNGFDTISLLFNNCFVADEIAVCGSRGWFFDAESADKKIILREAGRIETSISAAEKTGKVPILFLHYPPITKDGRCDEIMSVIKKHRIQKVYYGHIHKGGCHKALSGIYEGICLTPVSCDMLDFTPLKIGC